MIHIALVLAAGVFHKLLAAGHALHSLARVLEPTQIFEATHDRHSA